MNKKRMIIICFIIALMLSLCSCKTNEEKILNCSGVLRCDGNPVAGVEVLVNGLSCSPKIYSDNNGNFNIKNLGEDDIVSFSTEKYLCNREIKVTKTTYECVNLEKINNDINIKTSVNIKEAGTITNVQNAQKQQFIELNITVNNGFKFLGLYQNGNLVTKNMKYEFVGLKDTCFEAKFEKLYLVDFEINGFGKIKNETGYYEKSKLLNLNPDLTGFLYWEINGEKFSENPNAKYFVKGDNYYIKIVANFMEKLEMPNAKIENEKLILLSNYELFNIYINDNLVFEKTNIKIFDIKDLFKISGKYNIKINTVKKNFINSNSFTLNYQFKLPLETCKCLSYLIQNDKYFLTFKGCLASEYYEIHINDKIINYFPKDNLLVSLDFFKFDITKNLDKAGRYKIFIICKNESLNNFSKKSEELDITIFKNTEKPCAKIENGILKILNFNINNEYFVFINDVKIGVFNKNCINLNIYFAKDKNYKIKLYTKKKEQYYKCSNELIILYETNEKG